MHFVTQRHPLFVPMLVLVTMVMFACNPNRTDPAPSTMDVMMNTESVLTAGMDTLLAAVNLGTVDTSSREYAKVYAGLERANTTMDAAWAAYRAGDLSQADASRRIAMSTYQSIRPLLLQIAGEPQ